MMHRSLRDWIEIGIEGLVHGIQRGWRWFRGTGEFAPKAAPKRSRVMARLVRTIDGDTAHFDVGGRYVKVRLIGIDAPEMGFGDKPRDFGAVEAYRFADDRLCRAGAIWIELDPTRPDLDRYGRVLAWVWTDKRLLNVDLVAAGHARPMMVEKGMLYGKHVMAAHAQRQAQRAARQAA